MSTYSIQGDVEGQPEATIQARNPLRMQQQQQQFGNIPQMFIAPGQQPMMPLPMVVVRCLSPVVCHLQVRRVVDSSVSTIRARTVPIGILTASNTWCGCTGTPRYSASA
jgi:hypothetical protein